MKKSYNKFYLIGAGGYGRQLSIMLKTNKIINSAVFVDDKIKFNLKKFLRLKSKVNYGIFVGKMSEREKIFNSIKKKKKSFIFNFSIIQYTIALVLISLLYGVLFVLPIGGADMPVVISLLNAVTGIATAFAGALYSNKVMLAGGIIVGAAGVLLTVMMCQAMNRSLWKVLTGSFKAKNATQGDEKEQEIIETSISETALQLSLAKKVAIIPGYGLAVAQAQHLCKQIEKLLTEKEIEVHYIIHPVAGRMPGHMNVLLAEAAVEYNVLKEMDDVNDEMNTYDLALIIGANDVVNPAAEQNSDSPIYGMPIIKAYKCASSIVLKRGMSKGYAGVQNELFNTKTCKLLFGDAKHSLQQIINELKLV